MIVRRIPSVLIALCLLAGVSGAAPATGFLQQIPRDALGVVVFPSLSRLDTKTYQFFQTWGIPLPGPLTLLQTTLGVTEGVALERGSMIALLPGAEAGEVPHLCVWLPVGDYEAFVHSLDGDPRQRMTPVTVAGEDLLVARRDDYALLVDGNERVRLEAVLTGKPGPASPETDLSAWQPWIEANDASVVVFRRGISSAILWCNEGSPPESSEPWQAERAALRDALAKMPEITRCWESLTTVACGLKIDEAGNGAVDVRLSKRKGAVTAFPAHEEETPPAELPPIYRQGLFLVVGAGQVSQSAAEAAVGPVVEMLLGDLDQFGFELDGAAVARLRDSLRAAAVGIESWAIVSPLADKKQPPYTNHFSVFRVNSVDQFIARCEVVMQAWNALVHEGSDEVRLELTSDRVPIGDIEASEYSLDMAEAVQAKPGPEIQQAMERLFGPGGKFRIQIVPVDQRTVMISTATSAQATAAIEALRRDKPVGWDVPELQATAQLISKSADWRLFVSPPGYTDWVNRILDAMAGPMVGGPIVRPCPDTPPIGFSGGFADDELWVEVVLPAETMSGLAAYGQAAD